MTNDHWEAIKPLVNAEAEFKEITNDFGDPLEILREGISNAIDAHANKLFIHFSVEEINGARRLVIKMKDNGVGMSRKILSRDFWGLGFSMTRERKEKERSDAIGEKGHGTKIYFRSEAVSVRTQTNNEALLSECDRPLAALSQKKLHEPRIKTIKPFYQEGETGTEITVVGYNDNQREKFVRDIVKDYLLWFTKIGSIEKIFEVNRHNDFRLYLKCLDMENEEEIPFGHIFPDENADINALFNDKGAAAADYYVKRFIWPKKRLPRHPEVVFDAIISVEGDIAKRNYNPMLNKERSRRDSGKYRASDRYGIWLCKDYIPVVRVNDWIVGFGSGSNAYILLHGFINCQYLNLTANRGDIANTDPTLLDELRSEVKAIIDEVDTNLANNSIYTLRGWQEETRTIEQEQSEFSRRTKILKKRRTCRYEGKLFIEPRNESELFGLFIAVYTLHPELFDFEPLDYNTNKGIDIIAKNKTSNQITEGEYSYVEMKHNLQASKFNHAFKFIRWIVCWDFDKNIGDGTELFGVEETDIRILKQETDDDGISLYFLDGKRKHQKIQVIRLREYLRKTIGLDFDAE